MLIEFFVLLWAGAVACIVVGYRFKTWLLTFIATILFAVLAFQGFRIEVVSNGNILIFQEIVFVLLAWALMFVGTTFTLTGAISQLRAKKEKPGVGRYPGYKGK